MDKNSITAMQAGRLVKAAQRVEEAQAKYRAAVVQTLDTGASFAEVAKATGLSTNTLQRWKREVGQ